MIYANDMREQLKDIMRKDPASIREYNKKIGFYPTSGVLKRFLTQGNTNFSYQTLLKINNFIEKTLQSSSESV